MTPARVAERSGYCVRTIYREIRAGRLGVLKIRHRYRITEEDYWLWLRASRVSPVAHRRAATSPPVAPPIRGSLAVLRAIEEGA